MRVRPINLKEANQWVTQHHRHLGPVVGHRYSLSLVDDRGDLVGVAIVGRPIARCAGDPLEVVEVTRLATDGTRNACSMLLGAAVRAARAMGYLEIRTHTLPHEGGASLRAAGFQLVATHKARNWQHTDGKPRAVDILGDKWLWVKEL